ncbi:MAG TPA: adenylate/guanylate cyclase domain-containing protein, partial [Kiloniellaceae bacterium]|nr:adenylate/guanylate cyclase domain-containing protein [Kiloniellaceae bacterium]
MERRLSAVLCLDAVGYSRLMEADEVDTLARLKADRQDVIEPLIAGHAGRLVKLMGDGMLLEFASVVQAVSLAVELQRHMAERNEAAEADRRIAYRVGINLGDVFAEADDIYGDGVNVAARLEGLAEPGGICISGTAYDQVKSKLDCGFAFLGERQVKNIQEPVRVYRVFPEAENALKGAVASGAAAVRRKRATLALRPFHIYGSDEALSEAVEAFGEDLEIAFAQLRSLQVLASALSPAPAAQGDAAAELTPGAGVDYLLQGSVRARGERLRLNVQVIHLASGFNVWAEHYDCGRADFEDGADATVATLVATAQTQILLHEGAGEKHFNDERERVEHLAAKAWSLLYRLTPEALAQSAELAAAALSLDPRAARAHQVLACVLHHQYYMGFTDKPQDVLDRGLAHIDRAIAINEEDEYSHWVRGNILLNLRNNQRALAAFDRAREINPSFSLAVASKGTACAWAGRSEEAIALSQQALAANPKDPSNFFRFNSIAVAHFAAGAY